LRGRKGEGMAKIKFVSKTVKEKDLLSRDWLPISKFKAWQIDRGERITTLRNVLVKYLDGVEMWPKRKIFKSLDIRREQRDANERRYFNPSQVISVFEKMQPSEIQAMYGQIHDKNRKLRGRGR